MFYLKKIKILCLILSFLIISSCSDVNKDDNDKDVWIVGTSADNPPYEFMQDGRIVGFDIDLANQIAKTVGKELEFRNMEFHGLLAALSSSNVDLVIAGLSVTPERLKRVDFSVPYSQARIAFLYRTMDNFGSYRDLKGKVVGAQLGTIWSLVAHDLAVSSEFRVVTLVNNLMLVEDLKSGRIDAVVLEDAQSTKFVSIYEGLSKFVATDLDSSFAIALPKGSGNKETIDKAIMQLQNAGVVDALKKKWGLF